MPCVLLSCLVHSLLGANGLEPSGRGTTLLLGTTWKSLYLCFSPLVGWAVCIALVWIFLSFSSLPTRVRVFTCCRACRNPLCGVRHWRVRGLAECWIIHTLVTGERNGRVVEKKTAVAVVGLEHAVMFNLLNLLHLPMVWCGCYASRHKQTVIWPGHAI